jgi:AraC-like DNA-binding protein/ligand-binding sensor protein
MDFIKILKDTLSTYSYCTNISLSVINEIGNEFMRIGKPSSFCRFFKECTNDLCPCSQTHLYAAKQSEKLGESYIFSCPAGLIHYTVPIIKKNVFKGSVLAGPILMNFPDEFMVNDIIQKFDLDIQLRGLIETKLSDIQVVQPSKVRHLSKLLFIVACSLMGEEKYELYEKNKRSHQQSKIGESLQDLKSTNNDMLRTYKIENELLIKVKNGDIIGARNILNDLLAHILFYSGNDIRIIKTRTLELCTLLSRASIEGGADFNKVFSLSSDFLIKLNKIKKVEDISFLLINILDAFTENVFKINKSKNPALIKKCIAYINKNYKNNITLDTVANMVHLNSSYFSSIFKKEIGMNFSSYLNKIRIEQSMFLLRNTDYSILNIALEVGFEDQSYFSKVFKNFTGMTPKQYRQKGNLTFVS